MNRSNLAALACLVGALALLALGTGIAAGALLQDPRETIDKTAVVTGMPVPPELDVLLAHGPWLFAILTFLFFAAPAGLLATLGAGIWHFVGRRRTAAQRRNADLQEARESSLQQLLDELLAAILAGGQRIGEVLSKGTTQVLPELDPLRRERFRLFLREAGLDGTTPPPPMPGPSIRRSPIRLQRTLVRALLLSLVLVGSFLLLWTALSLAVVLTAKPELPLGVVFDAKDAMISGLSCSALAFVPLIAAAGLWWLARSERTLHDRWCRAWETAQERLLASHRRQIETLLSAGDGSLERNTKTGALARALHLAALPELDNAHKRRMLELLGELGSNGRRTGADLSSADLRGVDLSELSLSGLRLSAACLAGAVLTGTDLSDTDLDGSDLRGADLRKASLRTARLRGADLRTARLQGCDLRQADLSGARLAGANLWQTDLSESILTGAEVSPAQLESAASLHTTRRPDG